MDQHLLTVVAVGLQGAPVAGVLPAGLGPSHRSVLLAEDLCTCRLGGLQAPHPVLI